MGESLAENLLAELTEVRGVAAHVANVSDRIDLRHRKADVARATAAGLNTFTESAQRALASARSAAHRLQDAVQRVAELSKQTNGNAQRDDQLATAMTEMTTTVQEVARYAEAAAKAAQLADAESNRGLEVVKETVAAINTRAQ
jgi:methyl-accepting chemotaxis protein